MFALFVSTASGGCILTEAKGFTLIETLVALLIISISLLALGAFTIAVLSSDNVAVQRSIAVHLAEKKLEQWNAANAPLDTTNPETINGVVYTIQTKTTNLGLAGSPEVRTVIVSWKQKGKTYSVTLTGMQPPP